MHCVALSTVTDIDSPNEWVAHLVNSVGNIGVTCFILISGYFGIRFKADRFVQLIMLTTFYAVIVQIVNSDFHCDFSLVKSALVVPLYNNWFITCYLLLMLFAPFLNTFCEGMDRKVFRSLLILGFVVFCILPTAFNTPYYTVIYGGGKCLTYVVFIYFVGRYIRKYYDGDISWRKAMMCFLVSQILINVINLSLEQVIHKPCHIWSMDCSPLILASAISVFFMCKSMKFQSSPINWVSSSVLAVFLLDALRVRVNDIFHIEQYSDAPYFIVPFTTLILSTFVLNIAIDKVRILLWSGLENNLVTVICRIGQKISQKVNSKLQKF